MELQYSSVERKKVRAGSPLAFALAVLLLVFGGIPAVADGHLALVSGDPAADAASEYGADPDPDTDTDPLLQKASSPPATKIPTAIIAFTAERSTTVESVRPPPRGPPEVC